MTARLIYADSESSADQFYATGFFAPDPFLYLREASGTRHLVTSALEIGRARRTAQVDQVHDWAEIGKQFKQRHPDLKRLGGEVGLIIFFLKELAIQKVLAPGAFPLGLADQLRKAGLEVTAATEGFWPERACKRPDEVRAIVEALEITALGMARAIEVIRSAEIRDAWLYLDDDKLTSERVRNEINTRLVRAGAVPHHTIVSGGAQGADPHEEGSGPLPAHSPIILDIFPRVEKSGYWGDMTRTVCRGHASRRVKDAWNAVHAAQQVAFSRIRAGVSGKSVHEAVADCLTKAGFITSPDDQGRQQGFFHGTGHGLGLEVHEPPRISRKDQTLVAGNVVTVEPGLYYPEMGGVRLEDVVLVEADGCRNLTKVPKFLEV